MEPTTEHIVKPAAFAKLCCRAVPRSRKTVQEESDIEPLFDAAVEPIQNSHGVPSNGIIPRKQASIGMSAISTRRVAYRACFSVMQHWGNGSDRRREADMRADYALSHLEDGEICRAATAHGERNLRWNKNEWRFYYADAPETVCDFDEIEDWQIAAIKPHPQDHVKLT